MTDDRTRAERARDEMPPEDYEELLSTLAESFGQEGEFLETFLYDLYFN